MTNLPTAISSYIRISRINRMTMRKGYFVLLFCLIFAAGCKKDSPAPDPEPPVTVDTDDELMRDSIYYYYNLYSLWTQNIPDHSVLRTFTAPYRSNQSVLDALKALTPYYAGYGTSIDRFSYLVDDASTGQSSSNNARAFRMDTNDGYGIYFAWGRLSNTATVAYPIFFFVEGGSPAQVAGLTRGCVLLALNGDEQVTARINSDGSSVNSSDYNSFLTKFNTAIAASSLRLKVRNTAGEERELNLANRTYEINPISADTIYRYPEKNIGYLAFSSFEEVTSNNQNFQNFQRIFQEFEAENVTEFILDMRYNVGGYVSTAEYLANKMINAAGNGQLMFTYEVNAYLSQFKTGTNAEFADVYYRRNNNLALNKVYILVTEQTASAAELLINVLKPYLDVTLIAETTHTFGKPVGFFEQRIMNSVSLWATSFKTANKDGTTDYWNGLTADYPNVTDYIFYDFADPREDMIARALSLAGVSTSSANRAAVSRNGSAPTLSKKKLGMINKPEEKNMLKKRD